MTDFTVHTVDSAPEASRETLQQVAKSYGFLPNLIGIMAEAPALAQAYVSVAGAFASSSFSPTEQQIVLIAASRVNGCEYCVSAHSTVAKMSQVPADVIEGLRSGAPLADSKLEALRSFATAVVESRGWPTEEQVEAFLAAGYDRQNLLEVVLGIGLKTLSNYTNHITDTPLDSQFQGFAWQKVA